MTALTPQECCREPRRGRRLLSFPQRWTAPSWDVLRALWKDG
jgi:hypothetical protein